MPPQLLKRSVCHSMWGTNGQSCNVLRFLQRGSVGAVLIHQSVTLIHTGRNHQRTIRLEHTRRFSASGLEHRRRDSQGTVFHVPRLTPLSVPQADTETGFNFNAAAHLTVASNYWTKAAEYLRWCSGINDLASSILGSGIH